MAKRFPPTSPRREKPRNGGLKYLLGSVSVSSPATLQPCKATSALKTYSGRTRKVANRSYHIAAAVFILQKFMD
jgi:hypothetical protein